MTINLTPELEQALAEAARREGSTPESLALDCLRQRFLEAESAADAPGERTLADFLEGYIGVLDSSEFLPGKSDLSERSGSQFAEDLVQKRAEGRL